MTTDITEGTNTSGSEVITNVSNATAIQLFQGCTVAWDVRHLRHASSRVIYVDEKQGTSGGNCETRK